MGAVTKVGYAPSTFLSGRKRKETRWRTPLPFPVQVVSCVEVIDKLSKVNSRPSIAIIAATGTAANRVPRLRGQAARYGYFPIITVAAYMVRRSNSTKSTSGISLRRR